MGEGTEGSSRSESGDSGYRSEPWRSFHVDRVDFSLDPGSWGRSDTPDIFLHSTTNTSICSTVFAAMNNSLCQTSDFNQSDCRWGGAAVDVPK